jgi:hypothetical protein
MKKILKGKNVKFIPGHGSNEEGKVYFVGEVVLENHWDYCLASGAELVEVEEPKVEEVKVEEPKVKKPSKKKSSK